MSQLRRRGPEHYNWKGGIKISDGYRKILARGHSRADGGYVKEHLLVAERAFGRELPIGAVIHHVDRNGLNNSNSNLVLCQDQAYHMLLHSRHRIKDVGGNPNTEKICSVCHRLLSRINFSKRCISADGLNFECRYCRKVQMKQYQATRSRECAA